MGVAGLGIQGLLDGGLNLLMGGAFKGVGGFVSGMGRGITGRASNAYSKAGIGKVTSALGHGVGSVSSVPLAALGIGTVGSVYGLGKGLAATLPRDWSWLKKMSHGAVKGMTKEIPKDLTESGLTGLGGRIVNAPTAWALGIGVVGVGAMNGVGNYDYNRGVKHAVNGIMDTQGVAITPGSVNQAFTPIYNKKKNNGIRDLGTNGNLGFALHEQRNTGQIRR